MLEASNYTKNKIANAEFGGTYLSPTDTFFIKLFTTTLSLDGVGTEVVSAGYEPLEVENDLTNFPTTVDGTKANAVALQMSTFEEDSDEILAIGFFDADDNLLYRKNFSSSPIIIENGYYLRFEIGDITFYVA